MFALPLIAIALGFLLIYLPGNLFFTNEALARYSAVAVLAGMDTVLGGLRAYLEDKFDDAIFTTGFFTNAILAVGLVLLGERLGLETGVGDGRISIMMIGAVVVFSSRILNNLAALRRLLIERVRARKSRNEARRESAPVVSS